MGLNISVLCFASSALLACIPIEEAGEWLTEVIPGSPGQALLWSVLRLRCPHLSISLTLYH